MGKKSLMTLVLLVLMSFWTLLAWGTAGVVNWLPELARMAENGTAQLTPQLREGVVMLVPPSVLEAGLPWFLQLWGWLNGAFPTLVFLLGYAVWIIWGLGMIALSVLTVVVRKWMTHRLQPEPTPVSRWRAPLQKIRGRGRNFTGWQHASLPPGYFRYNRQKRKA